MNRLSRTSVPPFAPVWHRLPVANSARFAFPPRRHPLGRRVRPLSWASAGPASYRTTQGPPPAPVPGVHPWWIPSIRAASTPARAPSALRLRRCARLGPQDEEARHRRLALADVGEDLADHGWVFDAGNHPHRPATGAAGFDVGVKRTPQGGGCD